MVRLTLELPDELYDKIIRFEKDYYVPRFTLIRDALQDYVDNSIYLDYDEDYENEIDN